MFLIILLKESVEKFLKLSKEEMPDKFLAKYLEEYLEKTLLECKNATISEANLEDFLKRNY